MKSINAITAFKRRLRAAYRPRHWKNRVVKSRALRVDIEKAPRSDTSLISSRTSTAVMAIKTNPRTIHINPEGPQVGENAERACVDNLAEPFAAELNLDEKMVFQEQADLFLEFPENSPSCDAIDEQAIRDRNYVVVSNKDAEDYTHGPVRVVLASDGSKPCVALLLTPDFSAKVKRALEAQREFERLRKYSTDQIEVVSRFEAVLSREIMHHQSRLADIEREEGPDTAKAASLREELSILKQMLRNTENEPKEIWSQLETRASCVRSIQAHANAYLEEAFVCAKLLEPRIDDEIKLESRDLQQEYQAFRQALQKPDYDGSVAPLDISRDPMQAPPMTEEQQAQQNLVDAFWEANERLKKAQMDFDNKEYLKKVDYDANNIAFERGEAVRYITREDFDLHWLKRGQEMTRELLEAEEAFSAVKALASEAGLAIWADSQVSNSIEYNDDEMSGLEDCIAFAPQPGVTNWLTSLSDQLSPSFKGEAPEADEWEAGEVGLSDSISVVAAGEGKKRIDRWQKTLSLE